MYCPNCGREIEKGSKFCKFCGAKTEEGEIGAKEKQAQQVRQTLPSYDIPRMIPRDMLKEGESIVFETHPHKVFTLLGPCILGFILVLGAAAFFYISTVEVTPPTLILAFVILLLGIYLPLSSYLQWRYTIYALTTSRVIKLSGVITKDLYENSLDRIQDLRVTIGLWQRIFGCGDIMITTAGTAAIECVWENIKNPREIQSTLRALLG